MTPRMRVLTDAMGLRYCLSPPNMVPLRGSWGVRTIVQTWHRDTAQTRTLSAQALDECPTQRRDSVHDCCISITATKFSKLISG